MRSVSCLFGEYNQMESLGMTCVSCGDESLYQIQVEELVETRDIHVPVTVHPLAFCEECLLEKCGVPVAPSEDNPNDAINHLVEGQRYGRRHTNS